MNTHKLYRSIVPALLLSALQALAQTQYNGIYTFTQSQGESPNEPALLAQGTDGNLYGTLPSGGTTSLTGSAYAGSWFEYNMSGYPAFNGLSGTDLGNPESGFTLGLDGNLYGGVMHYNGSSNPGAIVRLSPGGALTVVCPLPCNMGSSIGPLYPKAPPIQGVDLNLYGVTSDGYVYQILMNQTTGTGTLGWYHPLPSGSTAPLIVGSDGNFYGTYPNGSFGTSLGAVTTSAGGWGGVFQITPAGNIGWYYNLDLSSPVVNSNSDGSNPQGPMMQAADGYLYGTASGGTSTATAGGTIFKIALNGAPSSYSVVHAFQTAEGTAPHGGLLQGSDGYLYGLTTQHGPPKPLGANSTLKTSSGGTLFRISTTGTNPSVLIPFFGIQSPFNLGPGVDPESTPILHTNGTIYGMTHAGGFVPTGSTLPYDDGGELFSYNAGLSPFVSIVGRRSAKVGDQVNIIGQGFLNATGVTFGGVAAQWAKLKVFIWSDTSMTVTVPLGARTGPVVVQETTGNLSTLYNFTINCSNILCSPVIGHPIP